MSKIVITAVQPASATVNNAASVVVKIAGVVPGTGNGTTTLLNRMPLPVTANGQTVFNIFSQPVNGSTLEINGVTYYNVADYTIGVSGSNTQLTWLNAFSLNTNDKLFFVTF